MEVYLVRHTETICESGICYGQTDVGLSEPYLSLFDTIKTQIPSEAIVYSSPLSRCTKLASHLSSYVITDPRLMEMNFGDWEMKNWDEIAPEELNPWMSDFVNVSVPNGESFVELHHRVIDFLENELDEETSKPIVIVTHAGVIRSVLCKISNLPLQDAFQNKVDFGTVLKMEL